MTADLDEELGLGDAEGLSEQEIEAPPRRLSRRARIAVAATVLAVGTTTAATLLVSTHRSSHHAAGDGGIDPVTKAALWSIAQRAGADEGDTHVTAQAVETTWARIGSIFDPRNASVDISDGVGISPETTVAVVEIRGTFHCDRCTPRGTPASGTVIVLSLNPYPQFQPTEAHDFLLTTEPRDLTALGTVVQLNP